MARLLNLHPVECPVGAKGVTVRRGAKWYNDTDRDLELVEQHEDGSEEVVGHARVLERALQPFNTLTDEALVDEHEEDARTVDGLLVSMRRAYGPEFSEDERVTVLTYWRTD